MKVVVQGILKNVENVQQKESLKFQYIMIEKPVRDNFTGELIFTNYYPATIFNEAIESCKAKDLEGQRIEATCYLNSQKVEKDDKEFYNLRLKVNSIKILPEFKPQP